MNNIFIKRNEDGNRVILNNTPTEFETRYNLSTVKVHIGEDIVIGTNAYRISGITYIVEWDMKVVFVELKYDATTLLTFLEDVGY